MTCCINLLGTNFSAENEPSACPNDCYFIESRFSIDKSKEGGTSNEPDTNIPVWRFPMLKSMQPVPGQVWLAHVTPAEKKRDKQQKRPFQRQQGTTPTGSQGPRFLWSRSLEFLASKRRAAGKETKKPALTLSSWCKRVKLR